MDGTTPGKTTLLNCLSAAIPTRERVVTAEEVFELKIPLPDVALQCRQPNLEGTGEIKLRSLGEGGAAHAAFAPRRR